MIRNITVYLDTDQLEFHERIRCGFIVAEDVDGAETYHNDVIDSAEYCSVNELINDVMGIFSVGRESILVAA